MNNTNHWHYEDLPKDVSHTRSDLLNQIKLSLNESHLKSQNNSLTIYVKNAELKTSSANQYITKDKMIIADLPTGKYDQYILKKQIPVDVIYDSTAGKYITENEQLNVFVFADSEALSKNKFIEVLVEYYLSLKGVDPSSLAEFARQTLDEIEKYLSFKK